MPAISAGTSLYSIWHHNRVCDVPTGVCVDNTFKFEEPYSIWFLNGNSGSSYYGDLDSEWWGGIIPANDSSGNKVRFLCILA